MKLLSLGAIAMDIVINSHELPKDDGFALVKHEEMLPGGSASNVSVSAGHLGLEVYQTGKIGDDAMGEEFRKTLVMDGVDDRYVVTKEGGTTLHTYILTAPGGKHCIFANTGDAVCTLTPEELPEESHRIMEIRNETKERAVCDYIAGMTDIYAIDRFKELFIPKAWSV